MVYNIYLICQRHLTEAFLLKGLKFCPTPERTDTYNARKDIREYFYCKDEVDGDFSKMPAFRMKSTLCLERNRECRLWHMWKPSKEQFYHMI